MEKKKYKTPLISTIVLKDELLESIPVSGTMNPEESDSKEFPFDPDLSNDWE